MKSLIRSPFTFEKPFSFYIDRFFDNDYDWFRPQKTNGQVNISEGKDGYTIEVTAPGFSKEELNIDIDNKVLTITGEHKEEKNDSNENYTRKEFCKQSFQRSFTIPDDVDLEKGFDAKFENGVLTVSVQKPKELPKVEPKKIEIK
jgi:HSP20 family protein